MSPDLICPGPQGSLTAVSVCILAPDMKLSQSVVPINLIDTLLLSAMENTPGRPLASIYVDQSASSFQLYTLPLRLGSGTDINAASTVSGVPSPTMLPN